MAFASRIQRRALAEYERKDLYDSKMKTPPSTQILNGMGHSQAFKDLSEKAAGMLREKGHRMLEAVVMGGGERLEEKVFNFCLCRH